MTTASPLVILISECAQKMMGITRLARLSRRAGERCHFVSSRPAVAAAAAAWVIMVFELSGPQKGDKTNRKHDARAVVKRGELS
jgi:hypothetical protein